MKSRAGGFVVNMPLFHMCMLGSQTAKWSRKCSFSKVAFILLCCYLYCFAEGHELASRLSKNIQRETDSCRNALESFNAAARPSTQLREDPPVSIEWVDIIDTSSWFWEAGVPGPANVPLSIRRNAIATFSNMKRAMEEVSLIKEDMANFFTSFLDEHQVVLAAVPPSGEGQYMQGARATLVEQLYAIECTLKECRRSSLHLSSCHLCHN